MGNTKITNRKYYIVNEDNSEELLTTPIPENVIKDARVVNNKTYTSVDKFLIHEIIKILRTIKILIQTKIQ